MNRDQCEVLKLRIKMEAIESQYTRPHPADTIAFVFQELGEVNKEMLRLGYGASDIGYAFYDHLQKLPSHKRLEMEFGDVMLMLCTLASQLGVDLSDALDKSVTKIINRWGRSE